MNWNGILLVCFVYFRSECSLDLSYMGTPDVLRKMTGTASRKLKKKKMCEYFVLYNQDRMVLLHFILGQLNLTARLFITARRLYI